MRPKLRTRSPTILTCAFSSLLYNEPHWCMEVDKYQLVQTFLMTEFLYSLRLLEWNLREWIIKLFFIKKKITVAAFHSALANKPSISIEITVKLLGCIMIDMLLKNEMLRDILMPCSILLKFDGAHVQFHWGFAKHIVLYSCAEYNTKYKTDQCKCFE